MPFTLIKGHYQPKVGVPDGDSVRFLADNLDLWNKLQGKPAKLGTGVTTINTVQLRFEGIDAIEKGAIKPLSSEARDNMIKLILFDEQDNRKPRGYILSRMTDDQAGRPICFVFCGNTAVADGSEVCSLSCGRARSRSFFRRTATGRKSGTALRRACEKWSSRCPSERL